MNLFGILVPGVREEIWVIVPDRLMIMPDLNSFSTDLDVSQHCEFSENHCELFEAYYSHV